MESRGDGTGIRIVETSCVRIVMILLWLVGIEMGKRRDSVRISRIQVHMRLRCGTNRTRITMHTTAMGKTHFRRETTRGRPVVLIVQLGPLDSFGVIKSIRGTFASDLPNDEGNNANERNASAHRHTDDRSSTQF